jgi:hypothetical protein
MFADSEMNSPPELSKTKPLRKFYDAFYTFFTSSYSGKHANVLRGILPDNRSSEPRPDFEEGFTAAEKRNAKGVKASAIAALVKAVDEDILTIVEDNGTDNSTWLELNNNNNLVGVCDAIDDAYFKLIPKNLRILQEKEIFESLPHTHENILVLLSKVQLSWKTLQDLGHTETDSQKVTILYRLLTNRPELILSARDILRGEGIHEPTFLQAKNAIATAYQDREFVQQLSIGQTATANWTKAVDGKATSACPHCKPFIKNEKGSFTHSPSECFYNEKGNNYKADVVERALKRRGRHTNDSNRDKKKRTIPEAKVSQSEVIAQTVKCVMENINQAHYSNAQNAERFLNE